jgi:peptide/nickel transport system permease protein
MGRYIIRRVLQAIPLVWLLTILVFVLIHLIPGGPLTLLINPRMSKAAQEALKVKFGLNDPIYIQYFKWLSRIFVGDFGFSFDAFLPVTQVVGRHLWPTFELFIWTFAVAGILAVVLGTLSALRQGTLIDYLLTTLSYFGLCMPVFITGLLAQKIFAVNLKWLPVSDTATTGVVFTPFDAVLDHLLHLVLPVAVLSIAFLAGWSRYIRSSVIEVVHQDYIRTARAKGVSSFQLLTRHALRNALIPFITVFMLDLGAVIGGATVTEGIFFWPGMGSLFLSSLGARDYPVLMAILLLSGVFVITFNLLADILYALVDPRIRYS